MKEDGIASALRRLSKRLGMSFSAHDFRYAIGTTAPMEDPQRPAIAPTLLGNSHRVADQYYNLAEQVDATARFQAALREDRQQTAALARRAFRRRF